MRKRTIAGFATALIGFAAIGAVLAVSEPGQRAAVESASNRKPPPMGSEALRSNEIEAKQTPVDRGFVIKRVLAVEGPIRYGDWHWDEAGVPPGPLVITVDLDARVLSVFRDGYEIGATAVLLGTQDKPTPLGVFPITQKKADHTSNLYGAPMPYMQRLTNDGITIHATKVENGYASHGCIGVPLPFAKKLFSVTALGDRVYITRGKRVGLGDQIAS